MPPAGPASSATAVPPGSPVPLQPHAIDLHAHFLPERYRAAALAHGQAYPDGMPYLPEWSAANAIAMMDEVGIGADHPDWGTVRFIKARTDHGPRLGVLRPDGMVELAREQDRLEPHFGDDGAALRALADAIHADPAAESDMDHLTLVKPVDPVSMRDFMVFEEHVLPSWRRSGMSRGPDVWYEQPIGYFSNAATIRGPRDPIEIPGGSERLDFELEVGAVIGREAVSVTPAEAADRIAGFCILCDWSARDLQFREMDGRLGPFKGKDFGSSLGPIFVTTDELASRRSGNGYDLLMTSSVNGRQYGSDRWSSAYWSFEDLISYASWNSRVEAGAIIGSGTCQGGCILELSARHSPEEYPWLAPGDEVTVSIELMGEIRADVLAPARGPWIGRKSVTPDGTQTTPA